MSPLFEVREKNSADDSWITEVATKLWGSVEIISKKNIHNILNLPTIIGIGSGKGAGFISYAIEGNSCEIVALYSAQENQGLGTTLIDSVKDAARKSGCRNVWLMTTNDNTKGLRFYQKRGFVITAIRTNVFEEQRKITPIPLVGNDGIPIRDEIELEVTV